MALHFFAVMLGMALSLCPAEVVAAASPPRSQPSCEGALTALPKVTPLIARPLDQPFDDPEYLFEMKYDGYRGIAYFEPNKNCRFISRQDNTLTQFQALCAAIRSELQVQDAIFDGEIIAHDETQRPVFRQLQRRQGPFQYIAFDLLWLNGQDLRSMELQERRKLLHKILPKRSSVIGETVAMEGNGVRLFELMQEHDLEGIVAKRLDGKYLRSTKWYKIKNRKYSQASGRGRAMRFKDR